MNRRLALAGLCHGMAIAGIAQCSIAIPQDTVTLYWGYEPMACATLSATAVGDEPNTIAWNTGDVGPYVQACDTISTWYFATLTDDTLCTATDSVFVLVVDVRCGNNSNKVLVCHVPPGNPANAHTICISENAVPAHLAHGCHLGACDTTATGGMVGEAELQLEVSPNPLDQTAVVRVLSTIPQHVEVRVVDAMGRTVSVLLNTDLGANEHRSLPLDRAAMPQSTTATWVEARGNATRQVRQLVLVR